MITLKNKNGRENPKIFFDKKKEKKKIPKKKKNVKKFVVACRPENQKKGTKIKKKNLQRKKKGKERIKRYSVNSSYLIKKIITKQGKKDCAKK